MKVLIADKFEKSGIDGLRALDYEVVSEPDLQDQALADAIAAKQPHVVIVRSTKVTDAMMGPSLKLIVRAGAGYNTIDVKAATAKKIVVANCPGKNSIAVAELAFGLMLSIDRRIPDNVTDLRAGKWNKKEYSKARGLHGQTLGLLGIGNIGSLMIPRAHAFGMPVVVWDKPFDGEDRPMTPGEAAKLNIDVSTLTPSVWFAPTPADVAQRCDVLSIHLALVPETRGLVNADLLGKMKPGSTLINCARGEIVDSAALTDAIRAKKLRAGLDVFGDEPSGATGDFTDPIVKEPGVYGTHHIGASTDQAQEAIAAETVRIVKSFKDTGIAPNAVN
jgi:D-3-phosphoglycerate dehydrogenase / 2-oxoglutarate reductase